MLRIRGKDPIELFWPAVVWSIVFPMGYLMYFVKWRSLGLIASLFFYSWEDAEVPARLPIGVDIVDVGPGVKFLSGFALLQICWMAVILFSPLQQLTRRLGFVVLGVLTLVALSEISKLDLHQYLKPAKVSEISSPTHNLPSHAAA